MNPEWKSCLLGNILTLQRGFDITKKEQKQGSVPVISSSGINSYHNTAKVKGPGVIIGRKGSLGTVFYVEEDYWPHDTTLWVKDFHGNSPKFTYYFLSTLNLASLDVGASNPTLNRNHVHLLPIYWPSLSDQHKIASILSAYDNLIENNTRRIAILEEMAQAIYQEWFVHFRYPGHEKNKMVESELGIIPETWTVEKLGSALTLQRGFDLPTIQRKKGDVPVYASTGPVGTHDQVKVKGPGVLTGRSGSLGTVLYVKEDFWPLNTTLWVKDFHSVTPIYAFYLLQSIDLVMLNSGAAVPTLDRNNVHKVLIILPAYETIKKFGLYISTIFDLKITLSKKNINLRRTRDLLLPKLISGEIDVETLDIDIPDMPEPEAQQQNPVPIVQPEPIDASQLAFLF